MANRCSRTCASPATSRPAAARARPWSGVVGRPSASVAGAVYTKALQGAHLTWTPDQLDKFLTDPATTVPGTAMPMSVADAKDRADLIAYLASPANKP